jgi:hypothetical protein
LFGISSPFCGAVRAFLPCASPAPPAVLLSVLAGQRWLAEQICRPIFGLQIALIVFLNPWDSVSSYVGQWSSNDALVVTYHPVEKPD